MFDFVVVLGKAEKKKELKKNKANREKAREVATVKKDTRGTADPTVISNILIHRFI